MEINRNRVNNLIDYVQGLMNKENGRELYMKYRNDIERVNPHEVFEILYRTLKKGPEPVEILEFLDKVINIFYKSLSGYQWNKPAPGSFPDTMMQENRALEAKLDAIKEVIKEKKFGDSRQELLSRVSELSEFNGHYLKKENILFPFLEKKAEQFDGLAIMWALHDRTRAILKSTIGCLKSGQCKEEEFNIEIGKLFFAMYGLIQKEELILLPAACDITDEAEWAEMQKQSMEYDFPFIERPAETVIVHAAAGGNDMPDNVLMEECQFKTETGVLSFDQILMIFNSLPVDLTFVDENNRVKYFTKPKDRIFPRSPAIIGRNVEKCHPPESVHVVRRIIEAFKDGSKDNAAFWIRVKGRLILIQYFALRDQNGDYRGTLEVSQDITGIKELQGEKRLLDWED